MTAQLVKAYYKFNNPGARWEEVSIVDLIHIYAPNYRRKYVFDDGSEVIREVGDYLFDSNAKIKELDYGQ